jgi:hypothetical protein
MVTAACKLAAFLFNLLVSFIGEGNWNTTMYLQKETGKQGLASVHVGCKFNSHWFI